jgi:tRNA G18 (ribose-2'-O)-methylase SpoU
MVKSSALPPPPLVRAASMADPVVARFVGLRDRDLAAEGLYAGESPLVVEKMLAQPNGVVGVLVADKMTAWAEMVPAEVPVAVVAREVLDEVVGFPLHRGVIALGRRPVGAEQQLATLVANAGLDQTLLVVEAVNNADNIGLLFRNAAALAVDGVVLGPGSHDPLYRRALRVSIGHALNVPWARSADLAGDIRLLRAGGYTVFGASTGEGAVPLDETQRLRRLALVVGGEYGGLASTTQAECDVRVRIPMAPGVDSLNVAVAAAICLHRLSTGARV